MIVKICGLTNPDDAMAAINGGASALGFNFYRSSPRYVADPSWIAALPDGPLKVGVFVNESPDVIDAFAARLRLDVAQLHGDETPAGYPRRPRVWKAVRMDSGFDLSRWENCPAEVLLLDGPAGALYGGAGRTFDWTAATCISKRIIIAGGLDADNVRQAIAQAKPWGVDACSGIESAPGRKDRAKMTAFLKAALSSL